MSHVDLKFVKIKYASTYFVFSPLFSNCLLKTNDADLDDVLPDANPVSSILIEDNVSKFEHLAITT